MVVVEVTGGWPARLHESLNCLHLYTIVNCIVAGTKYYQRLCSLIMSNYLEFKIKPSLPVEEHSGGIAGPLQSREAEVGTEDS